MDPTSAKFGQNIFYPKIDSRGLEKNSDHRIFLFSTQFCSSNWSHIENPSIVALLVKNPRICELRDLWQLTATYPEFAVICRTREFAVTW